ncbi:phosphonopyruvate decarboxylase [Kibdelosporangium banguiense]|uniref:Phosphonopyruvate decarboxylase n=1 Tax=Kibdelosporangium banguiense TaxID=1365924 RepID=A0ABS4TFL6_9PSEU|nr:phosphonopyruvate decarboxylase [Kibdelosporangium banguiense]MBP2323136.1 phosphonopyruvate decarboxylase [Kibdelosporangium banguiense]
MIDSAELVTGLRNRGVATVTGVPCSYLIPLFNHVAGDPDVGYVRVTQEGEALAIAAGCWLAGSTACVLSQNSGLGNMVNPLTSLAFPHRIPIPLIVTWRGEPGRRDEPQHTLMGEITTHLLEKMQVGWSRIPAEAAELDAVLEDGWQRLARSELPHAFIVSEGTMTQQKLTEASPPPPDPAAWVTRAGGPNGWPSRTDALTCLLETVPEKAAIVSTTGMTSRELFELADRPQHFYLVGAMGSAGVVGLGVALHTPRPVVVIDGDGAALMRLGALATVGAAQPGNLVHVVLDNGVHDSTGGQRTLSGQIDLPAVAQACGYRRVYRCADVGELADAIRLALANDGPCFIHLAIRPGSPRRTGRPTVHPSEVARRFRDFVSPS